MVHAVLGKRSLPDRVTQWICDICLLLFLHVLQTFSHGSGITVGSMDCINEFCFAANLCLMIDVHMCFSFTCPVLNLLLFSVTLPPFAFYVHAQKQIQLV